MKVTEQIDAMRALGTDPVQKLVTPRMIATAVMLPALTVIDDFVGMVGGWLMAVSPFRIAHAAVLDVDLAGAGMERRGAGPAQAVHLFVRDFADRLFLRSARVGRHAGRGPRHHAGDGGASVAIFILDLFIGKIFVSQRRLIMHGTREKREPSAIRKRHASFSTTACALSTRCLSTCGRARPGSSSARPAAARRCC